MDQPPMPYRCCGETQSMFDFLPVVTHAAHFHIRIKDILIINEDEFRVGYCIIYFEEYFESHFRVSSLSFLFWR